MRLVQAASLLMIVSYGAAGQPADCPAEPSSGPMLPLELDLTGRSGVPSGTTGKAYVAVPLTPPATACRNASPPPSDVLRGEPGDLLHGPRTPHVTVEVK